MEVAMPEARDRAVRGGAAAGEIAGGFFIRSGASPAAAARPGRFWSIGLEVGKENIPPWAVSRRRKSPLPAWYPRTPLRDITAIVNAWRRSRLRAARARQRARQMDLDPESTPQPTLPTNPMPQEPSTSEQAPHEPSASERTPANQFLRPDMSDTSSILWVTSFTSPSPSPIEHSLQAPSSSFSPSLTDLPPHTVSVCTPDDSKPTEYERRPSISSEYPLQTCPSSSSFSPAECPPQTVSVSTNLETDDLKPSSSIKLPVQTSSPSSLSSAELPSQAFSVSTNLTPDDSKSVEYEEKLSSSIDEIERVVMENLRKTMVPARKATQKNTLMSLR